MAISGYQLSPLAQRALEEFSTEFDGALASAPPAEMWASMFGLASSSRAIKTTFPIPISAAGYVEDKGDVKLRSLFARSLSVRPKAWADGFWELAQIVEAPDFIGWAGEPSRIALEAARLPNRLAAEMLEANPFLSFYADEDLGTASTIRLFANNHPVNVLDSDFGTFDNDHTAAAIDADMFKACLQRFRTRKGANGKPMGLRLTHLIVPPALEQSAKDFLESDLLRAAFLEGGVGSQKNTQLTTNNRFKGIVQLIVADELTNDTYVYPVASAGPKPWVMIDHGAPEEIVYDKNSDLYKDTGKIGIKYKKTASVTAALPHAIERIQITG